MELALKRPIIFFDIEATGLNLTKDRIVELSYIKVMPNGEEIRKTYRINPEIPMSEEAYNVHHISNADVADCPTFKQVAREIANVFEGCDIAGFNSNRFDIPLLMEEFARADVDYDFHKRKFVDVQTIYHKMEQRNLSAAYKFYCGKDLENCHEAMADTEATYEVLKAQLDKYSTLKNDIDELSKFSSYNNNADLVGRIVYNDKGQEVFNFGQHRGKLVEDVLRTSPSYYAWLMNGDFHADTKKILTRIKLRMAKKL